MTITVHDVSKHRGPRYIAIANALEEAIREGRLTGGTRLPTHRTLAGDLGVTVGTITRAYQRAAERGLVSGEIGRGTFVRSVSGTRALLEEIYPCPDQPTDGTLDLGPILPALANQPELLGDALRELVEGTDLTVASLCYGTRPDSPRDREAGARFLSRWVPDVSEGTVIPTLGAQHALSLATLAGLEPGDTVLTEPLGWFGMQAAAAAYRFNLHPIDVDEQGIVPESIETYCQERGARALYCAPTLHNPLVLTMSRERREAIVAVAREYDLAIFEDGVFDYLLASPPPSLASMAPERTFYITSVSKSVGAGLRLGYLCFPDSIGDKVRATNRAMIIANPPLLPELFSRWVDDGTVDRLLAWQRDEFSRRRHLAREIFEGRADLRTEGSWVWLGLPAPWTPGSFTQAVKERGIEIWPSEMFTVGRAPAPHAVRISLGGLFSRNQLQGALTTMAELLQVRPAMAVW